MSLHSVFSIDDSAYQRWQAQLLAYSHRRVGQPGLLTCLLSSNRRTDPVLKDTFRTRTWSPHPTTQDQYPPYNRIFSLITWLREAPPTEDTILLLDPDCVFLRPLDVSAQRGHPIAQPIHYMTPLKFADILRKHWAHPENLDGVGIPTAIHRDDLCELAPRWLEWTEAIRADAVAREQLHWMSDMWGYCIAAAEMGLKHELHDLARFQTESAADRPIIHYCYWSESPDKTWGWTKRRYRAWDAVSEPPDGVPLATVVLIRLLNEYASKQRRRPAALFRRGLGQASRIGRRAVRASRRVLNLVSTDHQ